MNLLYIQNYQAAVIKKSSVTEYKVKDTLHKKFCSSALQTNSQS